MDPTAPNIPVKKSPEEMEHYLEIGNVFNIILKDLRNLVWQRVSPSGLEVEFRRRCQRDLRGYITFPFITQINYLGDNYGYATCVSVEGSVAHAKPIPTESLPEGAIVTVDCGIAVSSNGKRLHLDGAFTAIAGGGGQYQDHWAQRPLDALKEILATQPKDTKQISQIIQETAEKANLKQVVSMTGHGIGYALHEAPTIHNAVADFQPVDMFNGLCFCPEPIFVKPGSDNGSFIVPTCIGSDGWEISTVTGDPASHFETTFGVINGQIVDLIGITDW